MSAADEFSKLLKPETLDALKRLAIRAGISPKEIESIEMESSKAAKRIKDSLVGKSPTEVNTILRAELQKIRDKIP